MGFGLLFIGYFITYLMSVHSLGFIFELVGYAIVAIACTKLRRYNRAFDLALGGALLMASSSLFETFICVWNFLYENLVIDTILLTNTATEIYGYVDMGFEFIFHALLLYAIRKIALETEVVKTAYAAVRNFVFICLYYVMYCIAFLPFDFTEEYIKYFSMPVVLLYFVCIVLDLVLIFGCYVNICDENDVDMPRKPSRFAFINKLREESDRRAERAVASTNEYISKRKEERETRRTKKEKDRS